MELGKKIVKIRKDNKLTQEDFAEKYNVTRQTISSWENSKSYPDLETLVKISDDFAISLDVLLKEDKKVIENISRSQKDSKKFKKIAIIFGVLIGVVLLAIGIYFVMYYHSKNKLELQFETTIKENNFYKDKNGTYTFNYQDNISYTVPNQKLPIESGYKFHFFAQHLYCEINLEENKSLLLIWIDYNYYGAELIDTKTRNTIIDVGLLGNENINPITEITSQIDIDEGLLKDAIGKGNNLYKQFYE